MATIPGISPPHSIDLPNRCLGQATACLYGLAEAAVLAAGYAPAIEFLHSGKAQSFVYDVADVYTFETVDSIAFHVAGASWKDAQVVARQRTERIS